MDISEITKQVLDVLKKKENNKIPVEISARHVHLSENHVQYLFGEHYKLKEKRPLSQIGQFLCEERVRLIGPKGVIDNIAILGPARNNTQVEISLTDSFILGIKPPLRQSGDIKNSPGIVLSYKDKFLVLDEGTIIAKNHIHMNEEDAARFNVKDGDKVNVDVYSLRPITFKDVIIRVSKDFILNMHIDFDEGNACMCGSDTYGKIVK